MVYITGDMHGDLSRFKNPIFKKMKAGDVLIVCGDFGFIWDGSRQEKQVLKKLREMPFTIAFVDGCHENFDILEKDFRVVKCRGGRAHLIAPNIFISRFSGFIFIVIGVTIVPGQIALQRMYLSARSKAVCFVIPMIADLVET